MNVNNVGKPLDILIHFSCMKELTLGRNLMNVKSAVKHSVLQVPFKITKEGMQKRNCQYKEKPKGVVSSFTLEDMK